MSTETMQQQLQNAIKGEVKSSVEYIIRNHLAEKAREGEIYDYYTMRKKGGELFVAVKEHSSAGFVQVPLSMDAVAA